MAAEALVPSRWLSEYVDVMVEILRFFDDRVWDCERDGPEVERTSALSCLARTCKTFFGLAIPILWRKLRSLHPIMHLIQSLNDLEGQAEQKMASLGIYPDRWRRISAYAAYVVEMDVVDVDFTLEPSVWLLSRQVTHGRPFLPNLAHLRCNMTSAEHTGLVNLVSPSLKKLVVHCSILKQHLTPSEQHEWAFALWIPLSAALRVASQLTHVSLSFSCTLLPNVLTPISRSRSLQSLQLCVNPRAPSIHAYDPVVFQALECLEDLDVNFELAFSANVRQCEVGGFRALRSLAVSHGPGSNPCYFSFASSSLTSLTIHRYRDATTADFRTTCAIWARLFPSLQSFSCELAPTLTVPLRLADAIAPLLHLRDMREFKLTFALTSQLIVLDSDLTDVAQSWPHLTLLMLVASSSSNEPSWEAKGPGARSLEAFKRHCPALVRLWLPHLVLRARDVDVHVPAGKPVACTRELGGHGENAHGLREFVVRWIDADDYQGAAALVDRAFPCFENRAALWGDSLGQEEEDDDEGRDARVDNAKICTHRLVLPFNSTR